MSGLGHQSLHVMSFVNDTLMGSFSNDKVVAALFVY